MAKTVHESGMTLMEVIIAILLITVVMAGIAVSVTWSLNTIKASRESAAALQAVQQEMETMRNSAYAAIGSHTFPVPSLKNQDGSAVNGSVAVQSESGKKRVSVNVSWISSNGRNMNVSLVTYFTKSGINQR